MKCRIEDCDMRNVRKQLTCAVDGMDRRRIVQWRQAFELDQLPQDAGIDECGRGEVLAAVHHAVYHRIYLSEVAPVTAELGA